MEAAAPGVAVPHGFPHRITSPSPATTGVGWASPAGWSLPWCCSSPTSSVAKSPANGRSGRCRQRCAGVPHRCSPGCGCGGGPRHPGRHRERDWQPTQPRCSHLGFGVWRHRSRGWPGPPCWPCWSGRFSGVSVGSAGTASWPRGRTIPAWGGEAEARHEIADAEKRRSNYQQQRPGWTREVSGYGRQRMTPLTATDHEAAPMQQIPLEQGWRRVHHE